MTKALNVDTIFNLETVLLGYDHWFLAKFHDHYVPTNNIPFTYEKSKNIQIYPNPATNQITLTYKQMDISSICIYNMQGILVYESKIPIINTHSTIKHSISKSDKWNILFESNWSDRY